MNRETFLEKIHIRHDIRALSNTLAYYYGNVLRDLLQSIFLPSRHYPFSQCNFSYIGIMHLVLVIACCGHHTFTKRFKHARPNPPYGIRKLEQHLTTLALVACLRTIARVKCKGCDRSEISFEILL